MDKPTYTEIAEMLMRLTVIAENSIPSDDLSNSQLAAADAVISESWKILDRIKEKSDAPIHSEDGDTWLG